MYETSDFRRGLFIEIEGVPFQIMEFQHVKPGKGNSFTRTKIKNLLNSNVIDRTFKSGDRVGEPDLERRTVQFLYKDHSGYQFMDLGSFEQVFFGPEVVGDNKHYLKENLEIEVLFFKGRPITLQFPTFVVLKVTYCEPAVKGDTASGGSKPATVETGLTVNVPFHVKQDDILKIDTRTGEYVEKVK